MTTAYFYKNTNSRFLAISGRDALAFIQNLVTNDVNLCTENKYVYSCLLTPQGKFFADFFIFKNNEYYYMEVHKKFYEDLIYKLEMYKLRSEVNIIPNKNLYSYVYFGDLAINNVLIKSYDPRNVKLGKKIISKNKINTNIKQIYENEYHEIHIKNNIPYSPFDLDQNKSLLLENNFDNINAISWEKGCYVGQEITARMKYRALLKKRIYPLVLIKGLPKNKQSICENEIELGKIISMENNSILAMLKIEFAESKIKSQKKIKTNDGLVLDFIS